MFNLKDKVVVITGAARGIGKGIAEKFSEEGSKVIVADILKEHAEETAKELQSNYNVEAEAYEIDLLDDTQIEKMMEYVYNKYGKIDILVNNAGIQIREWATDFDTEKLDLVFNLNLRSYYISSRVAARYMKKQGYGSIVCISSGNSTQFTSKRSPYNISKAGVNALAATFAVEWGRFNLRVNAVAPGYLATDMVKQGIADGVIDIDNIMQVLPSKRLQEVEEVANAVAFLASDLASGISGQTLFVDGGWNQCGLPEGKDQP
jgi:NAD(P)-dependent dehydrogenase (short-subunit alcohol dehydrogenase family)